MKTINLRPIALCTFLIGLLITSCSSDDDGSTNNNAEEIAQIENTAISGIWRITNLNDSGEDETSDFAGYDFTFNSDGSLVATNGTNTITGTWSVTDDNDDSDSADDIEFNILFPVSDTNDFEDLNEDWDIVSISSVRIALIDIGEANEGDEMLTFEKN